VTRRQTSSIEFTRRLSVLLSGLASMLIPSVASAAVTISIAEPPVGMSINPTPRIRVTYSSNVAPLDLASLRIRIGNEDVTSRFAIAAGEATYTVGAADALIAGNVTFAAEIRDSGSPSSSASTTQTYEVLPKLVDFTPAEGRDRDEMEVEVLGLDPTPARNIVEFAPCVEQPLATVDRPNARGTLTVPVAFSGQLRVIVNGKASEKHERPFYFPPVMAAGVDHSLFATQAGAAYGMGRNDDGQLGTGSSGGMILIPTRIDVAGRVRALAGGWRHTLAVTEDGQAWGWGLNHQGQLGDGTTARSPAPKRVLQGYRVRAVATALDTSFALTCDGTLLAFGWNGVGELGIGTRDIVPHPNPMPILSGIRTMASGEMWNMAASETGVVYGWGWNEGSQRGNGIYDSAYYPSPVPTPVAPAEWITSGCDHSLTITRDSGLVYGWGGDAGGQVGNGQDDNPTTEPPGSYRVLMPALASGLVAQQISTGCSYSLALTPDGSVMQWGAVPISDFSFRRAYAPELVPALSDIVSLAAGGSRPFSLAWKGDGTLWTWGSNIYGQLGDSTRQGRVTPHPVFGCPAGPSLTTCPPPEGEIEILPETTRWRPQRSTSDAVVVHFQGPRELTSATRLLITGPEGLLEGQNLAFEVVDGTSHPARYKITWSGPWVSGTPPAYLPSGNYRVLVQGVMPDQSIVTSSLSDPNGTVSLVEVASVEIEALPGGASLDGNPAVPLHEDEPPLDPTQPPTTQGRRAPRPGGGHRIFAEASADGEPVLDQVKIKVTTAPVVDRQVLVWWRAIDVDDPDGAPIDKDGDSGVVNDNWGAGYPFADTVTVQAHTTSGAALFHPSQYPGDNFRIVASTSEAWSDGVRAHQPSQIGEVQDGLGAPVAEGTQVSKMLTVWRTLNLEIDSMNPEPSDPDAPERNFVDGKVTQIQRRDDFAFAQRLDLKPRSVPGMTKLRDQSADRDGTGTAIGNGRFEGGTIHLGIGSQARAVSDLVANGITYVQGDDEDSRLLPYAEILAADFRTLVRGFVVNGWMDTGVFLFRHLDGLWAEAQKDGFFLNIGGVNWPIPTGGLGPLEDHGNGVRIGEIVTGANRTLPFRLRDDDPATAPFAINTDLLQDSDSPLTNAFAAAYIRPKRLPASIDTRQANFNRNVECPPVPGTTNCDIFAEIVPTLLAGRDIAQASPSYWASYIQGAFQPGESEDADPNSEGPGSTLGVTVGSRSHFGSQVYVEGIRESPLDETRERCVQITPAHELGHQFGRRHVDSHGIMSDACNAGTGRYFAAESLPRLRENGVTP
jgi:alpha-tubulin suppressor-like RCC1 family protein